MRLNKNKTEMPVRIDYNDPRYAESAAEIIGRHDRGEAWATAAAGVGGELAELREKRSDKLTETIVRRELRQWLRDSTEGKAV